MQRENRYQSISPSGTARRPQVSAGLIVTISTYNERISRNGYIVQSLHYGQYGTEFFY